jgi:hypothetical protein
VVLRVVRTTAVLLVLVAAAALAVALTRPSAPVDTDVASVAARVPCRASARACVRLSTNQAWLLRNGRVVLGPVTISHGKPGYRTPAGVFRVSFKNIDHVSSIYHSPMPYSVFFNRGIAFHAGNTAQRSHGCVRLSRKAARAFYYGLRPGDVVQVVR